jgi:peptidylprolyl isomerase
MWIKRSLSCLSLAVAASLSLAATAAHAEDKAAPPAAPVMPKIPAPADVGKPPADAEKATSGLVTKVLQKGTGTDHPNESHLVEVNYVGWQQRDGFMFDTSQKRGTTAKFPLKLLIKGWREGLKLMVAGEKRRMWIPADMAYGNEPRGPGKAYGDLCFDVELVAIHPGDPEPAASEKPAKKKKAH